MKIYVWLTFAFMGWGYYEMSGGADFVPAEPDVAMVEKVAPDIVARADTTALMAVSASNIVALPVADIQDAVAQAVALDTIESDNDAPEIVNIVATVEKPALDIREVGGSRVNMRAGPGTDFDVITTLNGGTKLEILEVNQDGWVNVSTLDTGTEGWMAERLLTDTGN